MLLRSNFEAIVFVKLLTIIYYYRRQKNEFDFFFQNNCTMHCSEKFLKVMQRVGVRIQEVQVMQNEGILGAPDPPK